ncbi:hypothetical protein [Halomarina pelagica]|uniref:hypothetical protein n=1 Tax=Halomarina pelagica TaxID=2961599 RepID=UPI0020C33447|nr:hypothetical protein [Halomarina sp. BND7]
MRRDRRFHARRSRRTPRARRAQRARPIRRAILLAAVLAAGLCAFAGPAAAHGGGARFDAPIPLPYLYLGAGATVAVTAGYLAYADTDSPDSRSRPPGIVVARLSDRTGTLVRRAARVAFFLLFVTTIAAGLLGRQAVTNFSVVFTWAVWLKGLALASMLVGSPWTALSPWRTLYRATCAVEGRALSVVEYPSRLGAWPALLWFCLAVGIVENLTVIPREPTLTAALLVGYAAVMYAGGLLFGPTWFRDADLFEVLYRLLGRVAPLGVERPPGDGYRVVARAPWRECTRPIRDPARVAFVVAMVYTVSFDGFAETLSYQSVLFAVRELTGAGASVSVPIYLLGFGLFLAAFALVVVATATVGLSSSPRAAATVVAPTVLPIAAAYEFAHNYAYVVRGFGRLVTTVAGWFDVALAVEPLAWLPIAAFWGTQVVVIVGGHVLAVVAAHGVIAARTDRRTATVPHLPLTALMVGYTVLSLWVVSRPVA